LTAAPRGSPPPPIRVFGRPLSSYLRFQRAVLVVLLVVGLARLCLSLAGLPHDSVRWLSMTGVAIGGAVVYGLRAPAAGFRTDRELIPLLVIQAALANAIVIAGIAIGTLSGRENVFTTPRYAGGLPPGRHVAGHVLLGLVIWPVLTFLPAALARRAALAR
jgi:hypothetical protein